MRETSCAAASEPPPRSKKSALRSGTASPSTACHWSASQASSGLRSVRGTSRSGSGHGSAARSTFPDVRTGRSGTTASSGITPAGSRSARCARAGAIEVALDDEVPDEHGNAGLARAHRGARGRDARQLLQRVLDLAELDAAAADLDLVVGAALEDQSLGVVAHQIAGAVRAIPAERGHRRELLEVFRGIEVAREADAADDELADLAGRDRPVVGADHGERPAVERQADAHGAAAVEQSRARDDGGLGGSVGVPHLPAVGGQPRHELGRARLAAEDQQPHALDRVGRPHRGEGRHRRDHGDPLADEPGREILPRPHERARRGHQARAVPPREPHLLA